ncbi:hypothetical protein DIPPA_31717, partial [Diplonema papillatum]
IRESLSSVKDLLAKIKQGETEVQQERYKNKRMEEELAQSLLEVDKLKVIADNFKEGGKELDELREQLEEQK